MASEPNTLSGQQEIKAVKMSRNYFCVDCNCSTRNPRLYLEHRRDYHHDPITIHKCELCVYASKHSQKLSRHLRTVHRDIVQDTTNQLAGNTSNQSFEPISASLSSLQTGKNTRLSTCKLCGLYTASKTILMEHVYAQHPDVRIYKCDQCEYSHYIRDRYNRHHRYHSMSHIRCKLCEFQTIYRWNLERHMRHHVDAVSLGFRCNKCNFTASTKQSITAHEIAHHSGLNLPNPATHRLPITEIMQTADKQPKQDSDNDEQSTRDDEPNDFDANDYLEVVLKDDFESPSKMNALTMQNLASKQGSTLDIMQQHAKKNQFFYCINCNFRYFIINLWLLF